MQDHILPKQKTISSIRVAPFSLKGRVAPPRPIFYEKKIWAGSFFKLKKTKNINKSKTMEINFKEIYYREVELEADRVQEQKERDHLAILIENVKRKEEKALLFFLNKKTH
jgi:hypothetical protein